MSQLTGGLIDFSQNSLYFSALAIAFNPTFWNIVARQEYHNKTLTRLFNGNSLRACYALAITIFGLGLFRDALYERALRHQPFIPAYHHPYIAYVLFAIGNTLVLTSYYALGITGTFLGDYFGILMDEPVTGFPFNITGAPMYWGSTMSFLGTSLLYGRPAGVLLTTQVFLVYLGALQFEDPFTSQIYEKREREEQEGKKTK
ncbi:Phosphatidyl-N-methylethanolamine N-methyltransferase [Imshaugia aleurites]|uniref:Phosphatidyl-N-methylethanolamine N-methyltransferase n=1 Tax=Imshaugia aleurites TaxID=172621 RepID=A0A8H3ETA8_9LECA|nr:Phosphatidyl-N-methylethanolamine N-methyltransferase [Imshaugia aleurites]